MVSSNINLDEGVMLLSAECSDILTNTIPKKLPDPCSFVLDCTIFTERFARSLCDIGSSVNLMPHSVVKRMGMSDYQPTRISLILADRSVRLPEGLLEDVPIKIGNCLIPNDFIVLEYDAEPKDPLSLGRPFLATTGALIDCKNGQIALNKIMKRPTIDGQTFYVDTLEDIAEEYFLEKHPEDPLERALVRSEGSDLGMDADATSYVKLLDTAEPVSINTTGLLRGKTERFA